MDRFSLCFIILLSFYKHDISRDFFPYSFLFFIIVLHAMVLFFPFLRFIVQFFRNNHVCMRKSVFVSRMLVS